MRKFSLYILILIVLLAILRPAVLTHAQAPLGTCQENSNPGNKTLNITKAICDLRTGWTWTANATTTPPAPTTTYQPTVYKLLAPLPCPPNTPNCSTTTGKFEIFDPSDPSGKNTKLGEYLNLIIKLIIGISAVMAVVMIVIGGIEYMMSELISGKEAGKERIRDALLGLLIALGAWTLLNTINSDLLNSDINIPTATINVEEQIKGYLGQGQCTPITSGLCSPANLAISGFTPEPPRATQASSICNGESAGNPSSASGVDKCSDGNPFSFGLFQINVLANGNSIPGGVCSNIFQTSGGGMQGSCLAYNKGVCVQYNCKVVDPSKYQSCVSYIINPVNNIAFAQGLQSSRGWGQWGFNNSCRF